MNKKHMTIPISYELSSVVKINPIISRYTVRVMYAGKNRNGTYFSKEVVNKMTETLGGIPVIGQYSEKDADFMAHGDLVFRTNADGSAEIVTEGIESYGFVDLQPNYWWSNHIDPDGVTREYLNVEVFLWTGRYPELERLSNGKNNHSMEIVATGDYQEMDGETYFVCDDNTYFTGLCILGEEVEPCFEGSAIVPQFALLKQERMEELHAALLAFNANPTPASKEVIEDEVEVVDTTTDVEKNDDIDDKADIADDVDIEHEEVEFIEKTRYDDLEEKYQQLLLDYQKLQQDNAELQDSNEKLNTTKNELVEKNQEFQKIINKNEKQKILNEFKNKISKDDYLMLVQNIDNLTKDEVKMQTLEFSVKYLTSVNMFSNNTDAFTVNTYDDSNVSLPFSEGSWQMEVYNRQKEEK